MINPSQHDITSALARILLTDYPEIELDIIFTDDLYSEALRVCDNIEYLSFMHSQSPAERARCNDLNGMYIVPNDIYGKQYVLVSNRQVKDGYSYITTVAHEVQHAINHTIFAMECCSRNFNLIYRHPHNTLFQIWDEFAARRTGHRIFTTFVMSIFLGYSLNEIKVELQNRQRDCRLLEIRALREQPISLDALKEIAGKLAMFSVWKINFDIEPKGLDDWSMKFLRCLDCYTSVSEVDFSILQETLNELWDDNK